MMALGSAPEISLAASEQEGSRDLPPGTDLGAQLRDRPAPPCSKRVGFAWCVLVDNHAGFAWCVLVDNHAGDCIAVNPERAPAVGEYKPPEGSAPGSWSSGNRRVF